MPYTNILHFHTRVRSYFECPLGQISTFSTLFGIKSALLSQPKASTSPFVPRAGFLEPCSCFFKAFQQAFLASLSTSARNQEKHQKNAKMRVFFQVLSFSQKNTSQGVVTFVVKRYWPAPTIPRRKRRVFKIFAKHTPSERHIWS